MQVEPSKSNNNKKRNEKIEKGKKDNRSSFKKRGKADQTNVEVSEESCDPSKVYDEQLVPDYFSGVNFKSLEKQFRLERARREGLRWVGVVTMHTRKNILVECDGYLPARPDQGSEVCMQDDTLVDRRVCGYTGGVNDIDITDRASIACGTSRLVGSIRTGSALGQDNIHNKENGGNEKSMNMSKEVENSLVPEGTLIRDPLLRPSSVRAATEIVTFQSPVSKKKSYKQKSVAAILGIFGGGGGGKVLHSSNKEYQHLNAKPGQPMVTSISRAAGVILVSENPNLQKVEEFNQK